MKNTLLATLAVVFAVVALVFAWRQPAVQPATPKPVGALASPDIYGQLRVHGTLVSGGCITTVSTTSATYMLSADEMDSCGVISIASLPTSAALALTTAASSSMKTIPTAGDSTTWIIDNLHTAAATTSTITAGTGVDIDGTGANDDVINGGVSGLLTCWRLASTDVRCIVQEMVDAG